jgi:hypothetical protein
MATKYRFEPGADGKMQVIIPGAERRTDLQHRADLPLRARKPQKLLDIGLFSDEADQLDLCEMFMDD